METLDQAVATLTPAVGTVRACRAVGQPRASWYRRHRQSRPPSRPPRPGPAPQPRALQAAERQQVLDTLHDERFWDQAPASVWATLLDEGSYLCSPSTMYRLLRAQGETGDRRRHATHPARVKPELVATAPNQCWSWDIERHEAPATERRCKTFSARLSQQPGEAGGSPTRETPGRVASSPDNDGTRRHDRTARVRLARREGVREEPAAERLSRRIRQLQPGRCGLDGGAHPLPHRGAGNSWAGLCRRPGGHGEGLRRSRGEAAGA